MDRSIEVALGLVVFGALALGIGSMLLGWAVDRWDSATARLSAWWRAEESRTEARRQQRASVKRMPLVAIHYGKPGAADNDLFDDDDPPETPVVASSNNAATGVAITQPERNALLRQGRAEALALLVSAGKVGETEGLRIVYGVAPSSTNPRYQEARAALKEELARLAPPPYRRTPEEAQQVARSRKELGLKG